MPNSEIKLLLIFRNSVIAHKNYNIKIAGVKDVKKDNFISGDEVILGKDIDYLIKKGEDILNHYREALKPYTVSISKNLFPRIPDDNDYIIKLLEFTKNT